MLPFRTVTYDIDEGDQIFSKLVWAVAITDDLYKPLLHGVTTDTNKDWTGIVNKESKYFKILETGKFLNIKFFQIYLTGTLLDTSEGTKLKIVYSLGWYILLVLGFVYFGGALMLASLFTADNTNDLLTAIAWLLAFPGLGTILLYRKLGNLEKKLEDLLNLK